MGKRILGLSGVCFVVALLPLNAAAQGRVVDLASLYYAAQTVDAAYNPDLNPDMDGDGNPDLSAQPNIQTLLDVLADDMHADHAATLAAFEANEALAYAALDARFPGEPIVEPLSALWAVYMTVQGDGSFTGPTQTGMVGLVEVLWELFSLEDWAGAFNDQSWEHGAIFVDEPEPDPDPEPDPEPEPPTLAVTGDGLVNEGDRVVFEVSVTDALDYRWYKDGALLPLIVGSELVLDPVTMGDAGGYYCEIDVASKATLTTPTVTLIVSGTSSVPVESGVALVLLVAFMVITGVWCCASPRAFGNPLPRN